MGVDCSNHQDQEPVRKDHGTSFRVVGIDEGEAVMKVLEEVVADNRCIDLIPSVERMHR